MTTDVSTSSSSKRSRAYEADYLGWLEDQIALLEAGDFSKIDTRNIAEEIGSIARRQYDCLEDAARALTYNLMKWDLLPDRRSASVVLSIDAHREQITRLLFRNPSLSADTSKALRRAYVYATYDMMRDSELSKSSFASECPYGWDTLRTREIIFETTTSPSRGEHS